MVCKALVYHSKFEEEGDVGFVRSYLKLGNARHELGVEGSRGSGSS